MHDTTRAIDLRALLERADELLNQTVVVRGYLRNRGANYFSDLQTILEDAEGRAVRVDPWLPLEIPPPHPGARLGQRPRVLGDFLDKDVVLTAKLTRDGANELLLVVKRAQVVDAPRLRRLTAEQLAAVAGVGGEGICGYGALTGELAASDDRLRLITAHRGTRSEVSFDLELAASKLDLSALGPLTIYGLVRKATPYTGTIRRAHVVHRPQDPDLVPGAHLRLTGRVDNRELVAIGGEAMPSGSYLVLTAPIRVGGCATSEVFLEHPVFRPGAALTAYGRLELRSVGGVETPLRHYAALSGVSDLTANEPWYDGFQFHSALTGASLRVLVIRRAGMFDAPDAVVVLDPAQARAFFGAMGGFMPPGRNPFHGFAAQVDITVPTDADRAAVIFDAGGQAVDAESLEPLILLAREEPPPNTADMFTHEWYYDPVHDVIYHFVSGGIAGFINRLQSVIHGPGEAVVDDD